MRRRVFAFALTLLVPFVKAPGHDVGEAIARLAPITATAEALGSVDFLATPSIKEAGIARRISVNGVWQRIQNAENILSLADNLAQLETLWKETVAGNDIFRAAYKGAETLKKLGVAAKKGKQAYDLIAELYNNYQEYSSLVDRITWFYEDLAANGINSMNRAASVLRTVFGISNSLKGELEFIDAILDMDKSFSLEQKADYVQKMIEKYRNHAALLNAMWKKDLEDAARIRNAIASLDFFNDFIYGSLDDGADGIRLFEDPDWSTIIKPISVDRDVVNRKAENVSVIGSSITYVMPKVKTPDETTDWLYEVGDHLLDVVSVIIVILGLLYALVNFIRESKGDKQEQHRDALFKVIAGCLASIALLQLAKLIFY